MKNMTCRKMKAMFYAILETYAHTCETLYSRLHERMVKSIKYIQHTSQMSRNQFGGGMALLSPLYSQSIFEYITRLI